MFAQHFKSLVEVIEETGNPFLEESKDLLVHNTRNIADTAVVSSACHAEETGKNKYQTYVNDRLLERSIPISDHITSQENSKASIQVFSLKSDVSRLYIACQSRDGDLHHFFRRQNQACPHSLSNLGKLRQETKADIISCLENCTELTSSQPNTDVII